MGKGKAHALMGVEELLSSEAFAAGEPKTLHWDWENAPLSSSRRGGDHLAAQVESRPNASAIATTLRTLQAQGRVRIVDDRRPAGAFHGGREPESFVVLADAIITYQRHGDYAMTTLYSRGPRGPGAGAERFADLVAASTNPWFVEGSKPPQAPDGLAHEAIGLALALLCPARFNALEVAGPVPDDAPADIDLLDGTEGERLPLGHPGACDDPALVAAIVEATCGPQWAMSNARTTRDAKDGGTPIHPWRVREATTPRRTTFLRWVPPASATLASALKADPGRPGRRLKALLHAIARDDLGETLGDASQRS